MPICVRCTWKSTVKLAHSVTPTINVDLAMEREKGFCIDPYPLWSCWFLRQCHAIVVTLHSHNERSCRPNAWCERLTRTGMEKCPRKSSSNCFIKPLCLTHWINMTRAWLDPWIRGFSQIRVATSNAIVPFSWSNPSRPWHQCTWCHWHKFSNWEDSVSLVSQLQVWGVKVKLWPQQTPDFFEWYLFCAILFTSAALSQFCNRAGVLGFVMAIWSFNITAYMVEYIYTCLFINCVLLPRISLLSCLPGAVFGPLPLWKARISYYRA